MSGCLKNSKEASVAEAKWGQGKVIGNEIR